MTALDLVAIIDRTPDTVAWVKDMVEDFNSSANTIPPDKLTTRAIGKEVFIVRGPKHDSYTRGTNNIAYFHLWGEITEQGTGFGPLGSRPPSVPVSHLLP
jgi:hypothetical protein